METDSFWALIEDCRTHGSGTARRTAWLRDALTRLPARRIVRFQACLECVTDEGHTWNLWAAADRIFGGWCSDDAFCCFLWWLVGLGRPVYEAAVSDPDALARAPEVRRLSELPRADWTGEDRPRWDALAELAHRAYADATGAARDDWRGSFCTAVERLLAAEADVGAVAADAAAPGPDGPWGRRWSALDEAECARRLPRLSALFPLPTAGRAEVSRR
ncbi:Protein of unknown function [Actinacidiphila yanglinensis]|uniref:DUF4240 domain-containing protein n=1 Tax=Actinacidiphila yanglinensis TaxID=310779 RepID=A0A1H5YVF5_9ACTN|nr:DUF4240 domain-containing protein [Actinacidiphila yanglinensis]SEG27425.1 Protein of unknown function [Actinacidiphila yanglinensis]